MATIKLNGVDQPLSPITGTDLNDKLTVDGESLDSILATLGKGKDLVEITNGSTDSPAFTQVDNNITVNGGDGDDTFQAIDGLVTLTGKLNGVAGNDDIHITSAKGATVQGGLNADTVTAGTVADLNVAGSNANAVISDSSILGGDGPDTVSTLNSAELTDSTVVGGGGHDDMTINGFFDGTTDIVESVDGAGNTVISTSSFIKGGDGKDTIVLADGAQIDDTLIAGNDNADTISAGVNGRGTLQTVGSLISGGAGDDVVDVALAGPMTIKGGSGKDFLAVGSGQTVNGGQGADTFSIEGKGGATIEDYDALTQNCFCSDVIQVDGNKLFYDTYEYKATKELYTSASSWQGNIHVKAIANSQNCSVNAQVTFNAEKIAKLSATAVAAWKATITDIGLASNDLAPANYPNSGTYGAAIGAAGASFDTNGNTPRPGADVKSIGFGYGQVTGYITEIRDTANGAGIKERDIQLPELTVYTKTKFAKGDFSFLGLGLGTQNGCSLKQTLVFNNVVQATITNHWASFGISKKIDTKTLYQMSFGTNNFKEVTTGKANLIIDGVEDKTFNPTQNQMTDPNLLVDYPNLTRVKEVTQNAQVTLNLENQFKLWTASEELTPAAPGWNLITTGSPGISSSMVSWATLQTRKILTLTVAAAADQAFDNPGVYTPAMNRINNNSSSGAQADFIVGREFDGQSGSSRDTNINRGKLYAKISVSATNNGGATQNGSLGFWRKDAIIPSQLLTPTKDCTFPSTLNAAYIAQDANVNNFGKYTPADGGEFVKNYMWEAGSGLNIKDDVSNNLGWGSPSKSNGCLTANGASATSCSDNGRGSVNYGADDRAFPRIEKYGDAKDIFAALNDTTDDGAFSGSSFNVKELAADGMGDNVTGTVAGAPFRILFFDSEGSDNGLYVYSGTANYKNGDVTAVNTNPDASSAMGTKQTIVKVTGGKGHEIALSDINFV